MILSTTGDRFSSMLVNPDLTTKASQYARDTIAQLVGRIRRNDITGVQMDGGKASCSANEAVFAPPRWHKHGNLLSAATRDDIDMHVFIKHRL
jgi:hypothetical protein